MKIGVALSGCDIGGVAAFTVLKLLEDKGFDIEMVSSCSIPSIGAMAYSCGFDALKAQKSTTRFLLDTSRSDLDTAAANISEGFSPLLLGRCKNLAVNAVNASDRRIITFTNTFSMDTEIIRTYPLLDAYDALSASISLMDGLCGYRYRDCRLCDYGMWYGCPVYPLKVRGISRIVSFSFLPAEPKTSYEALVKKTADDGSGGASVHIPIEFNGDEGSLEEYEDLAVRTVNENLNRIYWRSLF